MTRSASFIVYSKRIACEFYLMNRSYCLVSLHQGGDRFIRYVLCHFNVFGMICGHRNINRGIFAHGGKSESAFGFLIVQMQSEFSGIAGCLSAEKGLLGLIGRRTALPDLFQICIALVYGAFLCEREAVVILFVQ